MDVDKQADHWLSSGGEDFEAARSLLETGHYRHALFFAHLAIEKTLKAHVTRRTCQVPPRIHNLERLADMAGIDISPGRRESLREFGVHQVGGRYPDPSQVQLSLDTAGADLLTAEEILEWLRVQ